MNKQDFNTLKKWFLDYTDSFLSMPQADKENLLLKKEHTLRVCDNMALICTDLCENDQCIALTVALLHDIGRFEQLRKYATFTDSKSEDHASLGVRIIKELDILNFLAPEEAKLIITAVENHNKAVIEDGLCERTLQICKLVRDADKLDIWHVVIGYYKEGLEKDNPTIMHHLPAGKDVSTGVYKMLNKHDIISFSEVKSIIDFKIVQMGWVFDINSDKALALTIERGCIDEIYKTLPQTARINSLYQMLNEYLLEKQNQAACF